MPESGEHIESLSPKLTHAGRSLGVSGPIMRWEEASPDNATALPNGLCRAITVTDDTGGNAVAVQFKDGSTATLYIPTGYVHPTCATHILLTGTTATTVLVGY